MKTTMGWVLVLAVIAMPSWASMDWERYRQGVIDSDLASWPKLPAALARQLIARHGAPDRVFYDRMEWDAKGALPRIVLHSADDFSKRSGVLEQSVSFEVPSVRRSEVDALGLAVSYDPARGELTAGAESEEAATLALNVAADVARGRRGVEDARDYYRKTLDLALSGKSARYTRGLLFSPTPRRRARRAPTDMLPNWGGR